MNLDEIRCQVHAGELDIDYIFSELKKVYNNIAYPDILYTCFMSINVPLFRKCQYKCAPGCDVSCHSGQSVL